MLPNSVQFALELRENGNCRCKVLRGAIIRLALPVTIKVRWNVHVTLTTAVQMGLHAVCKVVRVTGCLGFEDHTQ